MEYGRRDELKSEPENVRTTKMMRSVREILEEQGKAHLLDPENFESASEAPTMPPRPMPHAMARPQTADVCGVQRPPHMQAVMNPALNPAAPRAADVTPETAPAAKSRSLLSRLIGR